MKRLATTSMLCGTGIIIAPLLHNFLTMGLVAYVISHGGRDVHLTGSLSDSYPSWCLFIGACLLLTGIIAGFRAAGTELSEAPLAARAPTGSEG